MPGFIGDHYNQKAVKLHHIFLVETFLVAQVVVAPMTNVGCVPPSDEIGTTGSDHGVMVHPPQHNLLSSAIFCIRDVFKLKLKSFAYSLGIT